MKRREYNREWMRNKRALLADGAEGCRCPICLRRRLPPIPVGEVPGTYTISGHTLTILRQLAREFDELSGEERWQAEDFVLYLIDPRYREAA